MKIIIPENIKNKESLLKFLYIELEFPNYFGFNWDALSECLNDLSWIDDKEIEIFHNSGFQLDKENNNIYNEILNDAVSYWSNDQMHDFKIYFDEKINSK